MGDQETRGRAKDNQHLSVSFGADADPGRSRSHSAASSMRTVIEPRPNIDEIQPLIKRRRTQIVTVEKPSWLDLLKALFFGTKDLQQKLGATAEVAELEDAGPEMFDNKDCPFSLAVSAFSYPGSAVIPAKCDLDTGCYQGNLIGVDLAHRLGFTSFEPLKPREQNGGVVATGHVHTVAGAVHVSWYHSTSPQVFRDMRFLVSKSAQVDLVIGTHSIMRHQLLSPPNLGNGIGFQLVSEPKREDLAGKASTMKGLMQNANKNKRATPDEKQLAKKRWDLAELDLKLYDMDDKVKKLDDKINKVAKEKSAKVVTQRKQWETEKTNAESDIKNTKAEIQECKEEIETLEGKVAADTVAKKPGVGKAIPKL